MIDDVQSRLRDCLSKVEHLEEENRQLRLSAAAFGQLAERLSVELAHTRIAAEGSVAERPNDRESGDDIEQTTPAYSEYVKDAPSNRINKAQ
jgi:hypothetical protein